MNQFEISAEARERQGKGASRRLRRTGYIPAIVYGGGKDPVSIQLQHNDVLRHIDHEAFYSHILTLKTPSGSEAVVLKDLQRHPYKEQVMHMDFLRIDEHEKLTMRVPLHFVNEDICVGVKSGGGVIAHLMTDLEIVCLPRDLPEYIEVDIAELELNATLHLSDISAPEATEIAALIHGGDPAQPVVSVQVPRTVVEPEAELEGDIAEGEVSIAQPGEGADESAPDGGDT
ncbi:MAG: 50S ribosomal protein L25/general stress protein Ctc [Proteobacteria bacterium]|nr:MAG: 50S ribosomal protein L25/general stress protein Ctc [Pseudomonadota bacterium]